MVHLMQSRKQVSIKVRVNEPEEKERAEEGGHALSAPRGSPV